jgi:hypothetical protein
MAATELTALLSSSNNGSGIISSNGQQKYQQRGTPGQSLVNPYLELQPTALAPLLGAPV